MGPFREYNHLLEQFNANHRIGQGNGNRDRHDRQYDRNERGLRYSIRDIPIFDGKGDAMPHMSCHRDGGRSQGDTRHSMPLARRRGGFNFDI